MNNFDKILLAVKIGLGVGKSVLTGKPAKVLEKTEQAVDIAKGVRKFLKRNAK
ncbi:MAG: hypothetical protein ACO24B_01465 [Ilumatobacteraceae bacterium]